MYSFLILKIPLQSAWRLSRSWINATRWPIKFPLLGIRIEKCSVNQAESSRGWGWTDAYNEQLCRREGKSYTQAEIIHLTEGTEAMRLRKDKGKVNRPVRIKSSRNAIKKSTKAQDWSSFFVLRGPAVHSYTSIPILGCPWDLFLLAYTHPSRNPSPILRIWVTFSKDLPGPCCTENML